MLNKIDPEKYPAITPIVIDIMAGTNITNTPYMTPTNIYSRFLIKTHLTPKNK